MVVLCSHTKSICQPPQNMQLYFYCNLQEPSHMAWLAIHMQFVIDFLIKSAKMACVDVFLGCLLKCMDNQKSSL